MKNPLKQTINSGLAGVAGEFFVAGELSRLGYLATLTQRNTKGVDILVSNSAATKSATIQVKTKQFSKPYWVFTQKAETLHSPYLFYVLVDLNTKSGWPAYHVIPSHIVAQQLRVSHALWLAQPGKKGQKRNDSSMRRFDLATNEYLNNWALLQLD